MQTSVDLFTETTNAYQPLADRIRPTTIAEFVGQKHLLDPGKPLRVAIESNKLHSMIFWGPPGTGKTTLARMLARSANTKFISISAVLSGVKEIRDAIQEAKLNRAQYHSSTILFVDEVHRFNKAQQDGFLPHIENGTIYFVGATTENPSFELNNALLSRARVYVLKQLTEEEIIECIRRALTHIHKELKGKKVEIDGEATHLLARFADGDARRALNFLEISLDLVNDNQNIVRLTKDVVISVTQQSFRKFDKYGEHFYDQISALHKAVRGSDPDAALYWLARMFDGGADPLYVARRVVRMASEDIGNANSRGLLIALAAWDTYERLGSPEGELAIAHAIVYLACAPKSNALYQAFNAAVADAKKYGTLEVPLHLRNAPTTLMKELGYGKDYKYAHNEENAYVKNEQYLPDELRNAKYYYPSPRGEEQFITEWLKKLRGE